LTFLAEPRTLLDMADSAKRLATYDDLLAVPAHLVAEIIHGELLTHPRPAFPHARAASRLGTYLGGPFDSDPGQPGGWIILDEPELHLGHDVLVPDLAGWRRTRMPELPHTAACELAPDWACEVLSASTAGIDRVDKMQVYARERVTHIWHVDPLAQTLEVFRLDGATYRAVAMWRGDAVVPAEPFDAVPLALATLWQR
jgi:Uma2 family endonuclease